MRTFVLVSLALAASAVSAQDPTDARLRAAGEALVEAQAQGAANAARPGDENLSCEALQAELVTIAQGPEMQGLAGFAQQAQADLGAVQQAQAEAEQTGRSRPRLFRQMVQGAATGVVPGLDRSAAAAQQAAAMAQAAQAQAQTAQNLQRVAALGEQAVTIAGPAMRGAHVLELARARDCAWVQEGGMPPGALPPGAVPPGIPVPAAEALPPR